jgi:hypothetical protein
MKRLLSLLLTASCLSLSSCDQLTEKWTVMRAKGLYRNGKGRIEITDKKVFLSDSGTVYDMKTPFNYELEGKRMILEPASMAGLGGLAMLFGVTPEIEIVDNKTIKYMVNKKVDIYKRIEK